MQENKRKSVKPKTDPYHETDWKRSRKRGKTLKRDPAAAPAPYRRSHTPNLHVHTRSRHRHDRVKEGVVLLRRPYVRVGGGPPHLDKSLAIPQGLRRGALAAGLAVLFAYLVDDGQPWGYALVAGMLTLWAIYGVYRTIVQEEQLGNFTVKEMLAALSHQKCK